MTSVREQCTYPCTDHCEPSGPEGLALPDTPSRKSRATTGHVLPGPDHKR